MKFHGNSTPMNLINDYFSKNLFVLPVRCLQAVLAQSKPYQVLFPTIGEKRRRKFLGSKIRSSQNLGAREGVVVGPPAPHLWTGWICQRLIQKMRCGVRGRVPSTPRANAASVSPRPFVNPSPLIKVHPGPKVAHFFRPSGADLYSGSSPPFSAIFPSISLKRGVDLYLDRFLGGRGWTSIRAWNKQGGWTFIYGGLSPNRWQCRRVGG